MATIAAIALAVALLASGRSKAAAPQSGTPSEPANHAEGSKKMVATDSSRPDVPACCECSGNGKPPVVEGAATTHGATGGSITVQ